MTSCGPSCSVASLEPPKASLVVGYLFPSVSKMQPKASDDYRYMHRNSEMGILFGDWPFLSQGDYPLGLRNRPSD